MCIGASVGQNGRNASADVKNIQRLLNLNSARIGLDKDLSVDGLCGTATTGAIRQWQTAVEAPVTGRLDPGDPGMEAFRRALPSGFTQDKLAGIMPAAGPALIDRFFRPLTVSMQRFGIGSPLRMAHFLAQIGHESGDLRYQEELADGRAYEGRGDLGNTEPGDGPRFKGRGLIQLTGRANYQRFSQAVGRDLVSGDNATMVATDPQLAVDVAGWFWNGHGLSPLADADDIEQITRRINGGLNGLDDRETHLARGKWFLLG